MWDFVRCLLVMDQFYQNADFGIIVKRYVRPLIIFFIFLYSMQNHLISHAGVIVEFFRVEGQDGSVKVHWKTNTEIAISGFYIQRSLSMDTGYTRVSEFIDSQAISPSGAEYEYNDSNLINGTTYWYKLEIIDDDQNSSFYISPKSATPTTQSTSQPTNEINTPTQHLPTSAIQSATTTPIPTITTQPTSSGSVTSTTSPTLASTVPLTEQVEVTATLIPLPSLAFTYPPTETLYQTETPDNDTSNSVNSSPDPTRSKVFSLQYLALFGIALIWLIFGILVVYFIRKLR